MSDQAFYSGLQQKLDTLKTEGLFKPERCSPRARAPKWSPPMAAR